MCSKKESMPSRGTTHTSFPTEPTLTVVAGGSAGGTPGGTTEPIVLPEIADLAFEANPKNVLSVWVSWTTSVPTPSQLRFGLPGGAQWESLSETLTTEHRVLAIGMRAETTYDFEVLATDENGTTSASDSWTSGLPPFPVVPAILETHDPALMQSGWTLLDLYVDQATATTVAMLDEEGFPVWYYQFQDSNGGQGLDMQLTPERTLAIGGAVPQGVMPREVDLAG